MPHGRAFRCSAGRCHWVRVRPINRPKSFPPRADRHSLTPDRVVEKAAEIADREGIDRMTLTRVAEELGVSQPALYKHVRDASDLLRLVALDGRRRLLAELRDAAVGRSADCAVEAVADAWRAFVRDHPGMYAATDRHPLAGFADLEAAVTDIVDLLVRVVASYGLGGADLDHAAWSVRSALHGFVSLESERGHPAAMDLDESFRRMVALLCSGLRAGGGGGASRVSDAPR